MSATTIISVKGRQVWDSRGRPTVEAEIGLASGIAGRAIAPAGASTGSGEALDLRDGGEAFGGYGVTKALHHLSTFVAPALIGMDVNDQRAIDNHIIELDGTSNKSHLGGNATIAVSMAVAQTAASANRQALWTYLSDGKACRLPLPEIQIFGGGAHALGSLDIQDFLIVCPGATSFAQALEWTAEVYRHAGQWMRDTGKLRGVADEGGYWPSFDSNEEVLETLSTVIERAGYRPIDQVAIALDVAASEFGKDGVYRIQGKTKALTNDDMVELIEDWTKRFPIVSVEDPLAEDDHEGFVQITRRLGEKVQIIGDDYLVTSAERVRNAASTGACNAVLIKPNQRGTLSETLDCWQVAREVNFGGIVSARSGESEDVTICHLAVGWNVPQFKVGSFTRSERMAKWNEMLRIEEGLGDRAEFVGRRALSG